jgi:uncharacterized protein YbaR (Trm112 family)
MSKDNVLKKQFAEKDVNRLRNLVKGKHADKSSTSVGFTKGQEGPHSEGDIWTEADKTWTIKDGINKMLQNLMRRVKRLIFRYFVPRVKNR